MNRWLVAPFSVGKPVCNMSYGYHDNVFGYIGSVSYNPKRQSALIAFLLASSSRYSHFVSFPESAVPVLLSAWTSRGR